MGKAAGATCSTSGSPSASTGPSNRSERITFPARSCPNLCGTRLPLTSTPRSPGPTCSAVPPSYRPAPPTIKKRLADVLAKMKMLSIKETKIKFPASPDASIQEVASSGDLEYKDNQGQQQFGSFEVQERWQKVDDRWMLVRLVSRLSD